MIYPFVHNSIVGYTYDGAAYHPECFPEEIDPDAPDVGAVFSWEDAACELTCDVCFQPLLSCDCFEEEL